MEIIINETGKRYSLTMQEWTGSDWGPDTAQDIIIDSGFSWDEDAEAWRMDGHEDNLRDYLQDWEQYNTEADRDAYDEDERARLRDERPRSYGLDEPGRKDDTMKNFGINGTKYTVETCTAICGADMGDESKRQAALLVSSESNGEKSEFVVFGWEMPAAAGDFADMCDDSSAWESDWQVIKTVKK